MRILYEILRRVEATLLASAMLVIAAVTIANVFVRNISGGNLAFGEELNRFLIVLICFVGLSYAAGHGRHIRMSAFSDALPAGVRRFLLAFVCGATGALLLLLAWFAWKYAALVDRRSPVLGVPLRWVYLIAPLGLLLGALQYLMAAWRNLRGPGAWIAFEKEDGYEELELGTDGERPTGSEAMHGTS